MRTPPNELMVKRYRAVLGRIVGGRILLLTTIGRKSGKPHTVAVQYEKINGRYYIGAGNGTKSDWYRNILVNPAVELEIGNRCIKGAATPVAGEAQVADFMEYRLKKHPLMIGLILKMDGCTFSPDREQLVAYCRKITAVIVTPEPCKPPI